MNDLEMRILEVLTDDARTPVGQIAVMLAARKKKWPRPSAAWRSGASSSNTRR